MSYESLLDHTCDIYHLVKTDKTPGFGLPASSSFSYPGLPDETNISCHFNNKGNTIAVIQGDPQRKLIGKTKLQLPYGVDIRINDKVVNCETGEEYTAEQPRSPRNHHTIVMLYKTDQQEAL